uniref:OCRE domain-containing protein n=1 Tax=Setaria digitata TaxID=48799 RepID=A0A915PRH2_9BILA
MMEENQWREENTDSENVCRSEEIVQKNAVDEYCSDTGTYPEISQSVSGSPKHDTLPVKAHDGKPDGTCSQSVIDGKSENFSVEEFNGTDKEAEESHCADSNNAESTISAEVAKETSSEAEETTHDNTETAEIRSMYHAGKTHSQGPKHYIPPGWVYHGESDGYRYYMGCAGELLHFLLPVVSGRLAMRYFRQYVRPDIYRHARLSMYSVDRDGYWYMQDSTGNFVSYTGYQYNRGTHGSLFPRDSQGRFILPTNARGEKAFPVDTNNMPIFPFDSATHLPTFPVDENGQPVFPTGALGRPIVPVDTNGLAIFPRDSNGRFIFPSGPNGKPTAPVNVYGQIESIVSDLFKKFTTGIPVMPLDEQGKPVVPYDASGTPLIHLASDGITPLTEEEYQYSLQWNDYYSRYYKNTTEQVRPEDIDLPPCVPPPPSTQPPPPLSDGSVLSGGEVEKKTTLDPALKAKTKKMIEMQLKFSRKKLRDTVPPPAPVVASLGETMNTPTENVPLPRQPSDSPDNIDKIESPKERPPPPPTLAPTPDSSTPAGLDNSAEIKESSNIALDVTPKSLESQIAHKLIKSSLGDAANEQATALGAGTIPVTTNVPISMIRLSADMVKDRENPELSSDRSRNLTGEFGRGALAKVNERTVKSADGEISSGKQPEPTVREIANGTNKLDKHPQAEENIEEEKIKTKPSVDSSSEANENRVLRKQDSKNERTSVSHEKRAEKKMRYRDESKEKRRSKRRRSRSRSSCRDSHRRSRSRGIRHKSRSRTPRDYHHRSRYRSRSRDRLHKHEGSYCDRRSYRRYWTSDAEDRYRRRHSSSRDRSSRHERSTSRERTPTVDKSSRSHSYYEQSKSRSESPAISRRSSLARSISQYKSDSRNLSPTHRNSPDCDISQVTECESRKSLEQSNEDLMNTDSIIGMRKSARQSASPPSERSSGKGFESRAEKSKKHKKSKEKHRKRKKSHHRKRDKKKPSSFMGESESEEKRKASPALSDDTDFNLNTSLNYSIDEAEAIFNTKKEPNDYRNDKTKKRKERRKKKERHNPNMARNDVTKKVSQETLEEGEIITEKDMSPRAKKKVVNYVTSESDEDYNAVEVKSSAEQITENSFTKTVVSSAVEFGMNPKVAESSTKLQEDFNDAIIRSSVLSFDFVDEMLKIPPDNTNLMKLEKKVKENYEQMNPKRETKITVDLEDDGASSKLKDLTSDFNEITAREAEKLNTGSITEAMNKLKELRGYIKSKAVVSNLVTETAVAKPLDKSSANESIYAGQSLDDVPLPKEVQVAVNATERVGQASTPAVRTQEACTSAKIDLLSRDVRRKKEILKRKWEEDEEDELSRLRYEALRSKTRRLMNDLKAERRRLKRERLRATIAMRRARERSVDMSVDEILLADTSDSSETDDSEDYSSSHKINQLAGYLLFSVEVKLNLR